MRDSHSDTFDPIECTLVGGLAVIGLLMVCIVAYMAISDPYRFALSFGVTLCLVIVSFTVGYAIHLLNSVGVRGGE